MAAKVIHFKKNGSSAPQKFVAGDFGNNISAVLSSPRGAETIFLPFYRHRAARKRYFCHFIVTVRRGNNIFAVLSSPCGAGTIFLPFYRHRAARERYFCVLSSPCSAGTIFLPFQCLQCSSNTFPNGFDVCSPTASVQKCGENRAGMAAGLVQRGKRKAAIRNRMTAFCFEVPSRVELLYTVLQTVT